MPHIFSRIIRNCFALATVFVFVFFTPTANAATAIGGGSSELLTGCSAGYYGSGNMLITTGKRDCTACPSDSSYDRIVNSDAGSNSKITDCYAVCPSYTILPSHATSISSGYFAYYNGSSYPKCSYTVNCSAGYRVTSIIAAPYKSCSTCGTGYYCTGGTAARTACTSYRANTTTTTTTASSTSQCVCAAGYYLNGSSCSACTSARNTTSTQSCSDTTTNISYGTRKGTNGKQTCNGYYTGGNAGNGSAASQCTGCSSYGTCSYTYTCTCNPGYHATGSGASCSCAGNTYTVKYNLNGGSGTTPANTTCTYGTSCPLANGQTTSYYRDGYVLKGWQRADVTGSAISFYANNFTTTAGATITVNAIWQPCDQGAYKTTGSNAVTACTACAAGTTTEASAATSADACSVTCSNNSGVASWVTPTISGNTAVVNSCTVSTCSAKYRKNGNACTICGTGEYSTGGTVTSCSTCPTGYQNGAAADSQANCTMTVAAGHYVATANSATQSECTGATYNGSHPVTYGTTSSCSSCPAGYTYNTASKKASMYQCQIQCAAGTRVTAARQQCTSLGSQTSGSYKFVYDGTNNWVITNNIVNYAQISPVVYCPVGFDKYSDSTTTTGHTTLTSCVATDIPGGYGVDGYGIGKPVRYIKLSKTTTYPLNFSSIQAFTTLGQIETPGADALTHSVLYNIPAQKISGTVNNPLVATTSDNKTQKYTIMTQSMMYDLGDVKYLQMLRFSVYISNIFYSAGGLQIDVSEDGTDWETVWGPATISYVMRYTGIEQPYITVLLSAKHQCDAGTFATAGDVNYVDGRSCTSCSGATYQNEVGQTSCKSCPTATSGWTRGTGTAWTSVGNCYQYKTPADCSSGRIQQNATGTSAWGSTTVTSALIAPSGYYVNNYSCTACPNFYPYSDGGTAGITQCYSNLKYRDWTGKSICPSTPSGCEAVVCDACRINMCTYVAYANASGTGDGTIKSGCASNNADCNAKIATAIALPDHYANGETCPACPNGWRSPRGSIGVGDCGRILNYQPQGASTPTQIYLHSEQKTHPSLAFGIGDHVFYGNMTPVTTTAAGNMYVKYNNTTYRVHNGVLSSFLITTTPNVKSFGFKMSAKGSFAVDWGDGTTETIERTDTTEKTYNHTYVTSGEYTIGFSGRATGYSTRTDTPAISFAERTEIAKISGALGKIFPTINSGVNGGQPRFYRTFANCNNLTDNISANLFSGIYGTPTGGMFAETFSGCSGLTGNLPGDLFANIYGAPAEYMFYNTFYGCTGLTGNIPKELFHGISGEPAPYMFSGTFSNCRNLSGEIPGELFENISGEPAEHMFSYTFAWGKFDNKIPPKLFAGIKGAPAENMFTGTFSGCSGLLGYIPDGLFGDLVEAPANAMFKQTFYGCSGLEGSTARTADGTRLYDVMYNGQTWQSQMPSAFTNMYTNSGINPDD